jgi:catechol 2,3-dioxygenase-like lactoylglutathione lyase family enzyme
VIDRLDRLMAPPRITRHRAGRALEPRAAHPVAGALDLCVVAAIPLAATVRRLAAPGLAVELGPVARTGGPGPLRSGYVRDPDGKLVAIAEPAGAATGAPAR